jgi:hypothetical protein
MAKRRMLPWLLEYLAVIVQRPWSKTGVAVPVVLTQLLSGQQEHGVRFFSREEARRALRAGLQDHGGRRGCSGC